MSGDEGGGSGREGSTGRAGLVAGVAVVAALGAGLRLAFLTHGYPTLVAPDEPVVVGRAQLLLHGHLPTTYDWPTGSMLLLAAPLRLLGLFSHAAIADARFQYVFARWLFAAVSILLVCGAGLLGSMVSTTERERSAAAWTSALITALSYTAVRLGRSLQPEELQSLLAVAGLALVLRFDGRRDRPTLLWAALFAGLAAGTKYLGVLVLLPLAVSVLWAQGTARRKVTDLLLAGGVSIAAFVATVPATVLAPRDLLDGLRFQFLHQREGHLGYDGTRSGWVFHAGTSLPGTWGWGITALAVIGLVQVGLRGTRRQRLVAVYVVAAFGVLGTSSIEFPHYVLLFTPMLGAIAVLPVLRASSWLSLRRGAATAASVAAVAALLAPTAIADLRLVHSAASDDTRIVAAAFVAHLPGPLVKEMYTDVSGKGTEVGSVGDDVAVLRCGCFVEVSSYVEERYRREPERYAAEVAVYDRVRVIGERVKVYRPTVALSYRWDLLPQWGMDHVPLTGTVTVGPTLTIFKMPSSP